MNLRGAQATRFFSKPDPDMAGALIYGADAMRVALKRQDLIRAYAGPEAEEEMRVTRLSGGDLKADPAAVLDGLKAVGFFPGPRVVFVDGVSDAQAAPILSALESWTDGDAALVVTAGSLRKTSKLRKAFEDHSKAVAVGLYDDPMGRDEIDAAIAAEDLRLDPGARQDLDALAAQLSPGDFRQTLTKLALYAAGEEVSSATVAALAPATLDAQADEIIAAAADGRAGAIGPLMRRLSGQGVTAVSLVISTTRHFTSLHQAAVGGGIGALRPPVYGPRRDAMDRQTRNWGARKLEAALSILMETDLTLRSASRAPQLAVMERALIRLAMLVQRER